MSRQASKQNRHTARDICGLKSRKQAFVCLTAYTATMAAIADRHADVLLVGDSLGMVVYGFDSTLPVTLDMMILHGQAVTRCSRRALVIVDMPFASYQESPEQAFRTAARIMAETGCGAVKLEGGAEMAQTIAFLVKRGIPVMGHIGLQPQSVHMTGGYRVMGRSEPEQKKIMADADAISKAGAFSVVLECMDEQLAAAITKRIEVPTIGIGASASCDGQVVVTDDILGLTPGPYPKFIKTYSELGRYIDDTLSRFTADLRSRKYPGMENTYSAKKILQG